MKETEPGSGSTVEALDRDAIIEMAGLAGGDKLDIEILAEVDSTNAELFRRDASDRHKLCLIAESQSEGRGRRGRRWESPAERNVYLSLGWHFEQSPLELASLPLVVALAAARAVELEGLEAPRIKWPNDLLVANRKLGGCLVETRLGRSGTLAVMGVGINVTMGDTRAADRIDQPWTDLATHLEKPSRNRLAGHLVSTLVQAMHRFESKGFAGFLGDWPKYDALAGKQITAYRGNESLEGIARGVNAQAELLLEYDDALHRIRSGEVTLSGPQSGS